MQLSATSATTAPATVLASQTIDTRVRSHPHSGTTMWSTDRDYRLAGAREGIDTFGSLDDAVSAARALSAGRMPGLAVMEFRGGYRLHDVHTSSRSYVSYSTHDWAPDLPVPATRLTGKSSVPFAAGNIRPASQDGRHTPVAVRNDAFVALVDGARTFVPATDAKWAGRKTLVEAPLPTA